MSEFNFEDEISIREVEGLKFYIRNKKDIIEKRLYNGKLWSEDLILLIKDYIKKYNLNHCLNVGSHIGSISLPISKLLQKVTSIEAHPVIYSSLLENIKINQIKNIETLNVAISDKIEEVKFMSLRNHRTWNNSGGMHVFTSNDIKNNRKSSYLICDDYKVMSTTIDNLNLDSVDIIISDIEGMELEMMRGAKDTISKFRPIIVTEIWEDFKRRLESMSETRQDIINIFLEMDYILEASVGDNFIFIPKEKIKEN